MPTPQPEPVPGQDTDREIPRELQKFAPPQLRTVPVRPLPTWPLNGAQEWVSPTQHTALADPAYGEAGPSADSSPSGARGMTKKQNLHLWMLVLTVVPLGGSFALAGVLVALNIATEPYEMLIGFGALLGMVCALIWVSILVVAGVEKLLRRGQRDGVAKN